MIISLVRPVLFVQDRERETRVRVRIVELLNEIETVNECKERNMKNLDDCLDTSVISLSNAFLHQTFDFLFLLVLLFSHLVFFEVFTFWAVEAFCAARA